MQAELRRHLSDFPGPCLLVTHDPLEALVLADQLLVLEDGRIVQEGPPAQVARQPATQYVARLVGLNLYDGVADDSGVSLSGGGRLGVPGLGLRGDVLVAVRPAAIAVTSQEPPEAGCGTTWPARVTGLTLLAERVRLSLDGQPPALADVTPEAVARAVPQPRLPGVAGGPAGRPGGLSPPGQRGGERRVDRQHLAEPQDVDDPPDPAASRDDQPQLSAAGRGAVGGLEQHADRGAVAEHRGRQVGDDDPRARVDGPGQFLADVGRVGQVDLCRHPDDDAMTQP